MATNTSINRAYNEEAKLPPGERCPHIPRIIGDTRIRHFIVHNESGEPKIFDDGHLYVKFTSDGFNQILMPACVFCTVEPTIEEEPKKAPLQQAATRANSVQNPKRNLSFSWKQKALAVTCAAATVLAIAKSVHAKGLNDVIRDFKGLII